MMWEEHKRFSGYSLVELLFTMVLLGIIYSLALPSYESYLKKSRLTEGRSQLIKTQGEMERYLLSQSVYPEKLSQLVFYEDEKVESANAYYEIYIDESLAACPAGTCYVLVAEPMVKVRSDERLELYSDGRRAGAW